MGFSKLANSIVYAHPNNYSIGRIRNNKKYNICKITPHQMGGKLSAQRCGEIFQNPNRKASSNYGIGYNGEIYGYVDEINRAYTSSNWNNDIQAITIECSNSSNSNSDWPLSEATWNSLIKLCVDICKRYNFRLVYDNTPNGSLTKHKMFANTDCPGPWLDRHLPELANIVNSMLNNDIPKLVELGDEPMRVYQNGSTPEPVYADTNLTKEIGCINANESCDCFGIFENRAIVRYKVSNAENYKIGFCKWTGGVK